MGCTTVGGIGNLRTPGIFFPMEVGADISASLAASLASKSRLDAGQPNVIRPPVAANCRSRALKRPSVTVISHLRVAKKRPQPMEVELGAGGAALCRRWPSTMRNLNMVQVPFTPFRHS